MRPASEIRAELDALDAEACALDQEITAKRETLARLNARRKALEVEFQAAHAHEEQNAAGTT